MPSLKRRGQFWWYTFTIDGRRIRRSAKTADRRQAEDIAARDEWRHRQAAVFGTASVLTFGEAMAEYLTVTRDDRFLLPLLDRWEHVRIGDITPDEIRRAAIDLYPRASGATRNRQAITPARAIINHAAQNGHCAHIRVRRFPEARKLRKPANRAWHRAFANACTNPGLAALARFMFETGSRLGNAIALTWDDLDLPGATATFGQTKNGEPHTVNLSPGMVADLANLPRSSRKVFGFHSRTTVRKHWRSTIERAGIEYLTPHEAGRHAFATEMIVRHGVDIPTTAKIGNWKSHRLLSETYAHPEREKQTVQRVFGNRK